LLNSAIFQNHDDALFVFFTSVAPNEAAAALIETTRAIALSDQAAHRAAIVE
jgi:hypothetical protein